MSRVVKQDQIHLADFKNYKLKALLEKKMNVRVANYVNYNEFQPFYETYYLEEEEKWSEVPESNETIEFNKNSLYMDFETAMYTDHNGLITQKAYFNHMIHMKDQKKTSITLSDLDNSSVDV